MNYYSCLPQLYRQKKSIYNLHYFLIDGLTVRILFQLILAAIVYNSSIEQKTEFSIFHYDLFYTAHAELVVFRLSNKVCQALTLFSRQYTCLLIHALCNLFLRSASCTDVLPLKTSFGVKYQIVL